MSTITIELDEEHTDVLAHLSQKMGKAPDDVLRDAMAFYAMLVAEEGEGPPLTAVQIAQIEEGLEAARRGDVISHEQVVADIRAKFGR